MSYTAYSCPVPLITAYSAGPTTNTNIPPRRATSSQTPAPPHPNTLSPPMVCQVSFLEAAHPTAKANTFRLYYGGSDAVVGTAVVSFERTPGVSETPAKAGCFSQRVCTACDSVFTALHGFSAALHGVFAAFRCVFHCRSRLFRCLSLPEPVHHSEQTACEA